MGTPCACVLALLAICGSFSFVNAAFGGECYANYGLKATTCSEVYEACGSASSCSSSDGEITFYCSQLGCSGSMTNACKKMFFGSCEEADSELLSVGCECSKCNDDGNTVRAACYYPFNCSDWWYSSDPVSRNGDYRALIYVYFGVAGALMFDAIVISLFCAPKQKGELSTKEFVRKKLSCIGRGIYRLVLGSFILEDGTSMRFLDYVSDKRNLFGVIHCCKTSAKLRPRWMRLGAFLAALLVAISLSFIFGTRVYNTETCTYSQDTCDGLPMAVECLDGSGELYFESFFMVAVVSTIVSEASALAVDSLQTGSLRQKLQLAVTLLTAAGLVIFGVFFSNSENKGEMGDDYNGDSRRLAAIGWLLLAGWALSELAGLGLAIFRFVSCWICYDFGFRSRLEKARKKKSAGSAAIYPQGGQKLDPVSEPDGQQRVIEANDSEKPNSNWDDAVKMPCSMIDGDAKQNSTSDQTSVVVNIPKSMIEAESGQRAITADAVRATPAPVTSPKAKSVDHLDAGKQKSSRLDRPRALTENIKLEPPKRGDQQ